MDALEVLFTRRSIRKYTDAPVSDADLKLLLRAAMAAPSANNAQPWQFIVVRDQARREAIARCHPYAQMAPKAPLCIVVCGDLGKEKTPGFWVQDCSAAIQNIMLAARALGLGTVWTGVHPVEERVTAIRQAFGIPDGVIPLGIVVVGHPAQPFSEQDRYDEHKVHYDQW